MKIIVIEARAIRNADSGLPKRVDAMKLAVSIESKARTNPVVASNVIPAIIVCFISRFHFCGSVVCAIFC